ncbi:unnamed protein product, partial [Gadus morhua 'NCC']
MPTIPPIPSNIGNQLATEAIRAEWRATTSDKIDEKLTAATTLERATSPRIEVHDQPAIETSPTSENYNPLLHSYRPIPTPPPILPTSLRSPQTAP